MSVWKCLFGNERNEYKADVLSWEYTKHIPDTIIGTTGSGEIAMRYAIDNVQPAKEYALRFKDTKGRTKKIGFVTSEKARFPDFSDVTLVEDVSRFLGIPVRDFAVKGNDGSETKALDVRYI